jgi:Flp pilus assembly pilin Flp
VGVGRLRASELGASAVEYALLVGLIAVVIMGAVTALGSALFGEDVEVLGHVLEGNCDLPEQAADAAQDNVCG